MTQAEFDEALRQLGVDADEKLRSYDAVFHLETTAKNATVYYGTQNNAIRDESPEEAVALDDRVIAAWERHPYFRIIENLNGFEDKMRHLVAEIAAALGEPVPFEIRRRFLIDYPDTAALEALPGCHREDLEQVYLRSEEDEEIRIRRSTSEDGEVFYLTRRRLHDGQRRLEAEGRLSEREYMQFMTNADPERRPIRKVRYRLIWNSQHYEIDLYPFWTNQAVLEVSLRSEDERVRIPSFLRVQKEVTGNAYYEVSSLARMNRGNRSEIGTARFCGQRSRKSPERPLFQRERSRKSPELALFPGGAAGNCLSRLLLRGSSLQIYGIFIISSKGGKNGIQDRT